MKHEKRLPGQGLQGSADAGVHGVKFSPQVSQVLAKLRGMGGQRLPQRRGDRGGNRFEILRRKPNVRIEAGVVLVGVARLVALLNHGPLGDSTRRIDHDDSSLPGGNLFDQLTLERHADLEEQRRFFQGDHLPRRGLKNVGILARPHEDVNFDQRPANALDDGAQGWNAGENLQTLWRGRRGELLGIFRPDSP